MDALTIKPERITTGHYVLFAFCFLSTVLGGIISVLMSIYLPVATAELTGVADPQELSRISAYINALFLFGWAFGGFAWGIISDRTGRKNSLLLAILTYATFTLLTSFMTQWIGVVICRFFTGFGVGGVMVVSFTMISEVWPERSRAVVAGILSIAFPVGIFSAGLINYFVESWRSGFMVGLLPLIIATSGIWLLEESETWKQYNAKKKQVPGDVVLISPAVKKNLLKGALIFGSMLIGLWAIFSWLPSWVQTLVTEGTGQKERGLSMMMMGMGGLSGGFFSGLLVNKFGFRKSMLLCFTCCSVISFLLFKTNNSFHPVIYVQIASLALCFGASQGILSTYIPQLFPTGARATATGLCFNIGRIITATAVLFIGVLEKSLGGYGNAIFTFSLVFLVGMLVTFFIKDNNQTLKTS